MDNKQPFFSIIIPCYNSNLDRIKELLESIYEGGCSDDVEIIISDDRSTNKEYLNIVKAFANEDSILTLEEAQYNSKNYLMNIKITEVPDVDEEGIKLVHCPGNTRQNGIKYATGKWITFIDHDDVLIKDILKKVKETIEETNEQYIVYTDFYMQNMESNEMTEMKLTTARNWMHGKFYNLENFWKKYNLNFITNMESHEDVYITNKTYCILNKMNKDILYIDDFSYICRDFFDTTTNIRTDNRSNFVKFINNYFNDYIESTMGIYMTEYNKLKETNKLEEEDKNFYLQLQADSIMFLYFYIQSLKYNYGYNFNIDYEMKVKKLIIKFYKRFKMNSKSLYNYIINANIDKGKWYLDIRNSAINYLGYFIEIDSFYDFISKM